MTYRLVLTTCPDTATAESLASALVQDGLTACVNIVPGVQSIYKWKGELARDQECLLLMKTRSEVYQALEEAIRARHPYELPEVIAVPIETGLAAYLAWIDGNTEGKQ